MDITTFALEKWYVKYEFSSKYNLSASGVKPLSLKDLEIPEDYQSLPLSYSPAIGSTKLLETLANIYSVTSKEILLTNGAIEAIFLIQLGLLNKGDKVITIKPAYPALYQIAKDIRADIIEWKLEFSEHFQPDLAKLEKLFETYNPKMLIINFPNNPTGICLTDSQLEEICLLAKKYSCYLLSDEIYKDLSFAKPIKSAYSLLPETAISISSLSKAYGLPGLRIGWMIANPEIISKCLNLRHYTSLCCNYLGGTIADSVLKKSEMYTKFAVEHACKNYKILKEKLEKWKTKLKIDFVEPEAGVMVFIKINKIEDTEQFCIDFEKETSILLLPGNKYGEEYKQFFRLGYGGDTEEFIYCLDKLDKSLSEL